MHQRNIEKIKQNMSESGLLWLWKQSNLYSNQINTESRKGHLKVVEKLHGIFTCLSHTLLSMLVEFLKLLFPVKGIVPWFWRKKKKTIFWKNCAYLFTCLGATWRSDTRCLSLFCITWNSLRMKSQWAFLKNYARKMNDL